MGSTVKTSGPHSYLPKIGLWSGLLPAASAFVVCSLLTWHKWPDILVDFGMQLYLPWRIAEGDVLYRDVMYLPGGPLSQHFNALLFKIFGTSLQTLAVTNLTLTAGVVAFIYHRFLACTDKLTAATISLGIVLVFAFGHYEQIGNYNYAAPYSHELFHGLLLSVVAVAFLADWLVKRKVRFAAGAGALTGLVIMTKPEIFLALAAATFATTLIAACSQLEIRFAAKSVLAFIFGAAVPLLGFFIFFSQHESAAASFKSIFYAWVPLTNTAIQKNSYYQWCLGLNNPTKHLQDMILQFAAIVSAVAVGARIFQTKTGPSFSKPTTLRFAGFLLLILIPVTMPGINWPPCGAALPLLVLSTGALLEWQRRRTGLDAKTIFPALWCTFGLVLLAKMGFFTRIWHYGFVLAMPAFTIAIYLLTWLLPIWLEKTFRVNFTKFRAAFCITAMAICIRLFLCSEEWYSQKTEDIGRGKDKILTYQPVDNPFHDDVQNAVSWIEKNTPTNATLAVLPEGAIVNYLTRRINPTRYPVWIPPEVEMFGQSNMITNYLENPPDYVLMIARNTAEYGEGPFGYYRQYGTELREWIENHYDKVYPSTCAAGKNPLAIESFTTLQILKRHQKSLPTK